MTPVAIPQDLLTKIRPQLQPDEKVLAAKKRGLFGGGSICYLTDRRTVLIGKKPFEATYLAPDETIVFYEQMLAGGTPVDDWIYMLTDRRVLAFNLEADDVLVGAFALADVAAVQLDRVRWPGWSSSHNMDWGFALHFKDGSRQAFSYTRPVREGKKVAPNYWKSETQQMLEEFPRRVSLQAGVEFCPPLQDPQQPDDHWTFYVKSDLALPARCSACMGESSEYRYDKLSPATRLPAGASFYLGLGGVTLEVPYCPACHAARFGPLRKDRAVDPVGFNGMLLTCRFGNREYAQAFVAAYVGG